MVSASRGVIFVLLWSWWLRPPVSSLRPQVSSRLEKVSSLMPLPCPFRAADRFGGDVTQGCALPWAVMRSPFRAKIPAYRLLEKAFQAEDSGH